mgnify:CR=1 FL=1
MATCCNRIILGHIKLWTCVRKDVIPANGQSMKKTDFSTQVREEPR